MCLVDVPVRRRDGDPAAIDAEPKLPSAEAKRELERIPFRRQPRIDEQRLAARSDAPEPERERLPQPAHRCQVQATGAAAGQIVEVEPGRDVQRVERRPVASGSGEQARVDRRRQRAAVRGAGLVEVEVRDE